MPNVGLLFWLMFLTAQPAREWKPVGQLDIQRIPESSGLVMSRRHPGLFWTHSDSGNSATLFAIRLDGSIVSEVAVEGAVNSDWEDIAADSNGALYIGDIGNNMGLMPSRFIYKLQEPSDVSVEKQAVKVSETYGYQFPGDRFDSESLLVWNDELYVIAKTKAPDAEVYKLVKSGAQWLTPTRMGSLPIPLATGADLSVDSGRLLVCTVDEAQWYEVGPDLLPLPDRPVHRLTYPRSQIEACAIADGLAVFTNEQGQLFQFPLPDFERVTRRPVSPVDSR